MTDGFVEWIKVYAKEDAKKGVYMSEGFTQMRLARMEKCVSPDRSRPKADVMSAIQAALNEPHPMLQAFEKMLAGIQERYEDIKRKMGEMKAGGKTKSATYRQFMGTKMMYRNMLSMYRLYGLLEDTPDIR